MTNELPEERFAKKPIVRRIWFWVTIMALLLGIFGFSVRDLLPSTTDSQSDQGIRQSAVVDPTANGATNPPQGWGPDRVMFTLQQPPKFAVLNSISNATNYGDERNFVTAQASGDQEWSDDVDVRPGDRVTVRFYYENSAQDDLGESQASWIQGCRLTIRYTSVPAQKLVVQGIFSANNASSIWDTATLHSDQDVEITPIGESATLYNSIFTQEKGGLRLDSAGLFSEEGGLVGYAGMDGVLRPGYEFSGAVFVDFEVTQPSRT